MTPYRLYRDVLSFPNVTSFQGTRENVGPPFMCIGKVKPPPHRFFCEATQILNSLLNVHNSHKCHPDRATQVKCTDTHAFTPIVQYSYHLTDFHKTLCSSAMLCTYCAEFDTNRATSVEIMGQASLAPCGTVRLSLRNILWRPPIPNFS
jgi:hypothetical protein